MSTHNLTDPLVSCLCITRKKVNKLKKAIKCFHAQTYPNKELLILCEDDDDDTLEFLETIKEENVVCYKVPSSPKLSLGELRNISIDYCKGEYFCQWDDDDWYHEDRLTTQFDAAINNYHPNSILTNWIIFDEINRQAYFSMFRLWEGSILCKKEVLQEKIRYPAIEKKEDTFFINLLLHVSKIYPIVTPNLYIYVYHGSNTWNSEHFEKLFSFSQKLSTSSSSLIQDILEEKYTVEEGSKLLNSKEIFSEVDYFYKRKTNISM